MDCRLWALQKSGLIAIISIVTGLGFAPFLQAKPRTQFVTNAIPAAVVVPLAGQSNTPLMTDSAPVSNTCGFCVIGNTRTYLGITSRLYAGMSAERPSFVVNMGNAVNQADNENEWLLLRNASAPLARGMRYYGVPGTIDRGSQIFYDFFRQDRQPPWFSFVSGNAGFVILDSAGLQAGTGQMAWLEETARAMRTNAFLFLFLNQPVHSRVPGAAQRDPGALLGALVGSGMFDLVFSGNRSFYERLTGNGSTFVITGGGGAPLEDVSAGDGPGAGSGDSGEGEPGRGETNGACLKSAYHYCSVSITNRRLSFSARSVDGAVIDSFVIVK
jgi:hypothetical protein